MMTKRSKRVSRFSLIQERTFDWSNLLGFRENRQKRERVRFRTPLSMHHRLFRRRPRSPVVRSAWWTAQPEKHSALTCMCYSIFIDGPTTTAQLPASHLLLQNYASSWLESTHSRSIAGFFGKMARLAYRNEAICCCRWTFLSSLSFLLLLSFSPSFRE